MPLQKKQLTHSPQEQTCHAQSKSQFIHFVGVAVLNGEDLCSFSVFRHKTAVSANQRGAFMITSPVPPPHISCPREDLYRDKWGRIGEYDCICFQEGLWFRLIEENGDVIYLNTFQCVWHFYGFWSSWGTICFNQHEKPTESSVVSIKGSGGLNKKSQTSHEMRLQKTGCCFTGWCWKSLNVSDVFVKTHSWWVLLHF